MAKEYGFSGIELHELRDGTFRGTNGPLLPSAVLRQMVDLELQIPCLDALCDIADAAKAEDNLKELERCLKTAIELRIPYLRLHAAGAPDDSPPRETPISAAGAEAGLFLASDGINALTKSAGAASRIPSAPLARHGASVIERLTG